MTPRPEVREQVLAMLRHRGSATQKEILNAAGNRREARDERFAAIRELLAENRIEIISQRFGISRDGQAFGPKATRLALVRRPS